MFRLPNMSSRGAGMHGGNAHTSSSDVRHIHIAFTDIVFARCARWARVLCFSCKSLPHKPWTRPRRDHCALRLFKVLSFDTWHARNKFTYTLQRRWEKAVRDHYYGGRLVYGIFAHIIHILYSKMGCCLLLWDALFNERRRARALHVRHKGHTQRSTTLNNNTEFKRSWVCVWFYISRDYTFPIVEMCLVDRRLNGICHQQFSSAIHLLFAPYPHETSIANVYVFVCVCGPKQCCDDQRFQHVLCRSCSCAVTAIHTL